MLFFCYCCLFLWGFSNFKFGWCGGCIHWILYFDKICKNFNVTSRGALSLRNSILWKWLAQSFIEFAITGRSLRWVYKHMWEDEYLAWKNLSANRIDDISIFEHRLNCTENVGYRMVVVIEHNKEHTVVSFVFLCFLNSVIISIRRFQFKLKKWPSSNERTANKHYI